MSEKGLDIDFNMNEKEYTNGKKELEELKRRVNITYRTRIISADRLRNKNKEYKKLNMYYSGLITGLSILSFGIDCKVFSKVSISNILLMFSILLSYYMFYVSEKNLQERAYRMEETYKNLDRLKNKIDITLDHDVKYDKETCKRLYQNYERILTSIENHEQIDYYIYRMSVFLKNGIEKDEQLVYNKIKNYILMHKIKAKVVILLKYIIPSVVSIVILLTLFKQV